MTTRQIYLDNNATTQPLPEVIEAMVAAMTQSFGNPSSAHSRGDVARQVLARARTAITDLIGATDDTIFFTSGATEANNLAIRSCYLSNQINPRLVTTAVEHSSVLKLCEQLELGGATVIRVPVNSSGVVDVNELESALVEPTDLVSIQWVNNETGVIQPIEAIAMLTQRLGVALHVDGAQAAGKLPLEIAALPIDYLSLTAHKIHGPQGIGALYVRPGRPLAPIFWGGPQEFGRRAGTENVPGIAGFGCAAEARRRQAHVWAPYVSDLRDRFEERIQAELDDVCINGGTAHRVAGSSNICFRGIDGQALVTQLDQQNIHCSQSSACTNMRPEPSYVLRAMGLSEGEAYSSVRFSFAELNSGADAEEAARSVIEIVKQLRKFDGAGAFAA